MHPTIATLLVVTLLLSGCGDLCENVVLQTVVSPSGALKAVSFSRNCGATSGFNTQLSVLPAGSALPDEGGNAYISDDEHTIAITWVGDSELKVSGVGEKTPVKMNEQVQSVKISYAP